MHSLPGGGNAKIVMIATSLAKLTEDEVLARKSAGRIRDDLDNSTFVNKKRELHTIRDKQLSTQYGFNDIQVLTALPNSERAREILTGLANDPGIKAVMNKYKWKVGALCEMYPEGYVGVSDVCVMGLNENKGQRILLRLRTDDLKGFRKILSIKKVLYPILS